MGETINTRIINATRHTKDNIIIEEYAGAPNRNKMIQLIIY